jgi:hypothetical protein
MAGDHTGDQSFYDFLIEEPEVCQPVMIVARRRSLFVLVHPFVRSEFKVF